MLPNDLDTRLRVFLAEELVVTPDKIKHETDIVDDLRIYGDDVWELLEKFAKQYSVDMSSFRWYHHSGPEGCNPLWLLFKPWWARKTHVPIRFADLVQSARQGVWCVRYPEDEREA